jgi:hypothetical protein
MAVFAVCTKYPENDTILKDRIVNSFPEDYYEIGRGQWLVAFQGTAKQLYVKLFPEPEFPLPKTGITMFAIGGYWGHATRDMWEWLASKLEKQNA